MTFIIAEVGSNWLTFEDAKDSITMAKNCGADAVKFQLFTLDSLYGFNQEQMAQMQRDQFFKQHLHAEGWCLQIADHPAKAAQLPLEWLPKLKEKADACGIEFMCSAFSPELLKLVDPYVKRHKIASAELTYPQLLIEAKSTGKPVILSVGGSSLTDIKLALDLLAGTQVTLMYCVSAYPAKNINLNSIDRLREVFPGVKVGYSCHSDEWYLPTMAVSHHKVEVLEKHFKLRDSLDTPDAPHSLNPEQFKEMVDVIRGTRDHIYFPEPQEQDMLERHNRRLIATKSISPGETLQFGENFGCFRSLKSDPEGLHGFVYDKVNGKIAALPLNAGNPITLQAIKLAGD